MDRDETRRQMSGLVRRWHTGTETQADFAARHGISRAKLRYWIRHLPAVKAGAAQDPVRFAPVQVVASTGREPGTMEIALGTGERLIVRDGVSLDLVRTVLTTLRSTC